MNNKGGKRAGAGRKKGSVNKATADIKAYAQQYGTKAIDVLVAMLEDEDAPAATRRAAAADVLDRGFGRPAQVVAGDKDNPVEISLKLILSDINENEPRIPDDD